jgi:serine/threonine protein kinase
MIGTKLAHYEITRHLGTGGMGEVYQATDSKLGRSVAIKLLPEAFTHDADRAARFEREARVLASLNHPNIATIHGVEESGGRKFLVMELVTGETLAEKIKRGAIPLDESLGIATQITEALEAAHEKGVIHRDLKPANIKVTPEGKVKVLDFGLAKAFAADASGIDLSNSPTMMSATTPGMILGTAAYMSPEQTKGKETDRATDVWAFGCVLYEMLTGRRVFDGETVSEILAGVLKSDPEWNRLPAGTPEGIRRLLRRCLQREEKRRLRDVRDARIEIDEAQIGPQVDAARDTSRRRERLAWVSSLVLVVIIAAVATVGALRPAPLSPETRLEISTPPTTDPVSMAISPDGQKIVFVANSENGSRLWLRSLGSVSAQPLSGTESAQFPFWSPNNRSVGFFADGKLKRVDVDGRSVQAMANAPQARGGTWNRDGTILFAPGSAGPIFRMSDAGGEPVPLTRPDGPKQTGHRFPQFLADGRHFLYFVTGSPEVRGVYISSLAGSETRRLLNADGAATTASSGQLLFVLQGTLFAQDLDPIRMELTGSASAIAEHVTIDVPANLPAISASTAGPILYRAGSPGGQRQFVWFDRSGKEIGRVGSPDTANALGPSISPDGRHLALSRTVSGNFDIWLLDTARGVLSRFTLDPSFEINPVWSPDGARIVFNSARTGVVDLYQKLVIGPPGSEKPLLATAQPKTATDWSPDGRFLLYHSQDPKMGWDIWALPLDANGKPGDPFPVVQTNFDELEAQFSPDAKWIAYQSNETGRFEIYVQPFPGPGGRSAPISTNGGGQLRWRHDGKEIFYIALDGKLMAVSIRPASNAQTLEAGSPVPLFVPRIASKVTPPYIVSPDGQRFLINTITEDASTAPITVIQNWKPKP